jgi:hypothetical protein
MSLDRPVCPYCADGFIIETVYTGYETITVTGPCMICGGSGDFIIKRTTNARTAKTTQECLYRALRSPWDDVAREEDLDKPGI